MFGLIFFNGLCPNAIRPEQFDAKSCSKQLFFRVFWREMRSFVEKFKKLKMKKFLRATKDQKKKMFIFSFFEFYGKSAHFHAKTQLMKVVSNSILHRTTQVDCHLDTKKKIGLPVHNGHKIL